MLPTLPFNNSNLFSVLSVIRSVAYNSEKSSRKLQRTKETK